MSATEQTSASAPDEPSAPHAPLAIEAAPEGLDAQKLSVDGDVPLKFDALGPMVVNSDGVRHLASSI